jgi:hypothetical protein
MNATTIKLEFTPDQIRFMHSAYDQLALRAINNDNELPDNANPIRRRVSREIVDRTMEILDILEAAVAALDVHADHAAYDRKVRRQSSAR